MALFNHLLLLLLLLPLCSCADRLGEFCNNDKKIGSGQTSANIDHVLAELASKAPLNGFATASYGRSSESKNQQTVYGLAQCRGDVSTGDCSACIADAAKQIRQLCSDQADARIWFDYCFLHYDVGNFIGKLDTGFGIFYWNVENATEPEEFIKKLEGVMNRVKSQAVVPANRGLGKDETRFSPFVTIYGLAQCTRDLSQLSCAQCLATAVSSIPKYCLYKKGCRVLYSSCYLRYEIYPFFFPLDSQPKVLGASSRAIRYP